MNSSFSLKNEVNEFIFIFSFFNLLSDFNENFNYFSFFFFFCFLTSSENNEKNSFKNKKNLKKKFFKTLFHTKQYAV